MSFISFRILAFAIAPSASAAAQDNWRYCHKCHVLFFNGFPTKGRCPAGGGHVAQGFNFVVPHDLTPHRVMQSNWRYCNKCHAMSHDGYADKGRCPSGGGHHAQGYRFVLRYHGNFEGDFELRPTEG